MKVIYTSGYGEPWRADREVQDTALFLPKPITSDALSRKVREVLDAP
jgi:hypothetical protein